MQSLHSLIHSLVPPLWSPTTTHTSRSIYGGLTPLFLWSASDKISLHLFDELLVRYPVSVIRPDQLRHLVSMRGEGREGGGGPHLDWDVSHHRQWLWQLPEFFSHLNDSDSFVPSLHWQDEWCA
jgi:hypothetical protein